jgi:hypothetical protein
MAVFSHMQFMPAGVDQAFKIFAATGTLFAFTLRFRQPPPRPPNGSQELDPGKGLDPDQEPNPGMPPQPEGEAVSTATGTELAQLMLKSMTDWQEAGQAWACTPPSPRRDAATTDLVCIFAVAALWKNVRVETWW